MRGSLEARGVDTRYVIEAADRATGVTVVMSYGEDRANVTYPGAMEALRFADLDPEIFLSARHIHLSSLFMQPGLLADIVPILRAAHDGGATVSLDTQWDPAEEWRIDCREVLPLIDVFMPNEAELTALAHAASLDEAIGSVRPWLRRAMIVKRGSRGSVLVTAGGECREVGALLNREAVDTIGAGDSFNAGFIRCFVRGGSLGECQDAGNLTGAISTTAAGGTGAFADREAAVRTARERFGKTTESGLIMHIRERLKGVSGRRNGGPRHQFLQFRDADGRPEGRPGGRCSGLAATSRAGSIDHMGLEQAVRMGRQGLADYGLEGWIHLDHGPSVEPGAALPGGRIRLGDDRRQRAAFRGRM